MSPAVRRAAAGAAVAQLVARGLDRRASAASGRWQRLNYRGAPVSLVAGPALTAAVATAGPGLPGMVAGLGAGLAGAYDDAAGDPHDAKGFRGHVGALQRGRLSGGAVKLAAISLTGLVAAAVMRPRKDVVVTGAVIAASANLVNLLDLRPGRALKVGLAGAVVLGQPGVAGACAALLPADLGERRMLGDAGANALGAVLGVALVQRLRQRAARQLVLAGLVALTAASERVSFSQVIDRTPVLRRIDRLGRLP